MNLTELDIVNQCLATTGDTPVNAIDADHPYVAAALLKIKSALTLEQAKGWWFNTDLVTLHPEPNTRYIYVPGDTISVDPHNQLTNAYVQRGRRLYDRTTSTYEFEASIATYIVRELPLVDLPMLANHLVGARAVLDFQSDYDADGQKYNRLGGAYQQAFSTLRAEHIRQVKANMMASPSVAAVMRLISPMSRYARRGW